MHILRVAPIALALALYAPAAWSQEIDTPETRAAAAQRYAATFDLTEMMAQTFQAVAKSMPPETRDEVLKRANDLVNVQDMQAFMLKVMVELFTTQELNKLADFYGSAEGQSVLKKTPQMMARIMPYMQRQMMMSIRRALEAKKREFERQRKENNKL